MKITFNLRTVVCGGLCVAALFLSLLLSPLLLICSAPLFWLAMTRNTAELLGGAIIASLLLFFVGGIQASAIAVWMYVIILPSFLAHRIMLKREANNKVYWYPEHRLTQDFLVTLGLLCSIIFALTYHETQAVSYSDVIDFITSIDPTAAASLQEIPNVSDIFHYIIESLPALITFTAGVGYMASYGLSNIIAKSKGITTRPALDIAHVKLPLWMIIVFLIGLGSEFITDGMLQDFLFNLSLLGGFGLFLSGTGYVHKWLRTKPYHKAGLFGFYILTFIFIWVLIPILLLGIYHSLSPSKDAAQ